jgi:HD-like signal output (HDOD) protein
MSIRPLDEGEIRYQVSQIKELPPLPLSLKRLIEIIHSETDAPGELESIIRYDPSLVAKVLTCANSSYYGYRRQVKSIPRAVSIIGAEQVRSICICTLLMSLLSEGALINGAQREILWKHAFSSSRIAAEMNKKRPWMNSEEAAALGIIYDIGWILIAAYFNEQFTAILDAAAKRKIPPWYIEMQYGLDHSRLGKYLACRWALPVEFETVIEFHHSPEKSEAFRTEVRLMHLVDILAHSHTYPELLDEESTLAQCRELYISEDEWKEHQESAARILPEVDQLWTILGEHPGGNGE